MQLMALPQRELEIIKALWELNRPVSAAELNEYLKKGWRVQTLITHLSRMIEKGVVRVEKRDDLKSARYYYSPAVKKQTYMDWMTRRFVEFIHDGSTESLMASLKREKLLPKE